MRRIWGFLGLWLTICTSLGAATVELNKQAGLNLANLNQIRFNDWPQVQVSATLSLPAKEMMIELAPGQIASQMAVGESYRESIGQLPSDISLFDLPTSLDNRFEDLQSVFIRDRLGAENICLLSERTVGGKRYARVLVFPITVDSSGRLEFCDSITLTIGQQQIEPNRVSTQATELSQVVTAGPDDERSTPTANSDYVIITSAGLAGSFRTLAAHKTQTGYRTSIEMVEEIASLYSGRDDAEKIRQYLKDFYAGGGKYVLLGGDETVVPIRYAYSSDVDQPVSPSLLQVADLYFADLTGEWDRDGDGVWGEKTDDAPDLTPELLVGRLPLNTAEEVRNYIDKLIQYETNPGNGDPSYLNRAFFFSSDQMRDYSPVTQHSYVSRAYPASIIIDTANGIEAMRGDDPAPSNLAPSELGPVLSPGYGIINIIAHGRDDGFAVKSSGYNTGMRAMLWTNAPSGEDNSFEALQTPDRPAFYYSLACENGAFDESSPPFNYATRNMAQELIGERGGAVGLVAYSRWGWIGTSYILQRTFFDSLFAHPDRPAVQALYACKARYPYYRDLVLGQNFFGDPTLVVYSSVPPRLAIQAVRSDDVLTVTVLADGGPSVDARVLISDSTGVIAQLVTGQDGAVQFALADRSDQALVISAIKLGCTLAQTRYFPSIVTDVGDAEPSRPSVFSLAQNYPNPFNPTTSIAFSVPKSEHTTVAVFDLLGRRVITLVDGLMSPGTHRIQWSGTNESGEPVAAGIYFYRLMSGSQTETKKMLLLK